MTAKYHITTGVLTVDGWIEPDGTFFPCAPERHDYAADVIAAHAYGCLGQNGAKELEKRGWVRCTPPHLYHTGHITEAQLATAREVVAFNGNEFVNMKMMAEIERLEEARR